jgi:sugar phosphate isomerase/epimerase
MLIDTDSFADLTYCTNIHPANGWDDVSQALYHHAPTIKAATSPDAPFGIGLRLSGDESRELLAGNNLRIFRDQLDDLGCYVSLINGFPHGPFHGTPVKADVHAPDWRSDERLDYTCRLAEALATLLPPGGDGGISTNPLSYSSWIKRDGGLIERMTRNVARSVAHLVRVGRDTGRLIHLDIEPEPDGVIETSQQFVDFFENELLSTGRETLCDALGVDKKEAEQLLRDHVAVCLDTCHAAVMFEPMDECIQRYLDAGVRIGRVQISSAVRASFAGSSSDIAQVKQALTPFSESVYLHQVVGRRKDGSLVRFPDLHDALTAGPCADTEEWRIHFHVPIFADAFDSLQSTQFNIRELLDIHRRSPITQHFEIETYTWDVLPANLKLGLTDSIIREYAWVRDCFSNAEL